MMAYPPNNVSFINAQPKKYDIHNNFGMFTGERLLYHSEMTTGCCEVGDHYYTSVTDIRYISRKEEYICCCCCCEQSHHDNCIYLNDIAELREIRENIGCGNWSCESCCICCTCFCCCRFMSSKRLQLRGVFGTHTIHINEKETSDFELMITEAIGKHKQLNQH